MNNPPIVLSLGPFSITTANANLGFLYGKKPTTQALTLDFEIPTWAESYYP